MTRDDQHDIIEVIHPEAGHTHMLRGDVDTLERQLGYKIERVKQIRATIRGVPIYFSPNTRYQYAAVQENGMTLTINGREVVFDLKALRDKKNSEHSKVVKFYNYVEWIDG